MAAVRVADSAAAMAMAVVLLLLLTASAVESAGSSSTVVAGMVFCDQCKDGARGLFDYPLYGARVAIQCGGGDTPMTVRECSTNWFGGFSVRMEGSPDMNRCTARVVHASGHCSDSGAAEPRELTLAFRMLGLALYTVQPLLSQPDKPMDFCPAVPHAPPAPAAVAANAPSSSPPAPPLSVAAPAPVSSPAPPLPPFWRRRPRLLPPIWRRPPTVPQERPALPNPEPQPLPTPPPPSTPPPSQGSACAYDRWAVPEHRCHWKVVTPNTTVAMAFGPLAAQRYGPDMTLRDALDGRGDAYRTLLREATAALLNAYYNAPGGPFLYPTTASVIDHLNGALLSSAQRVLIEGARFRRANAGGGGPAGRTKLPCELAPCGIAN
ncbi:WW domain-binding protein 11-like [Lolium rigidum]|uniref:WW domain-binding protein 11-like n=1 Tax=Lolium rigidum TaxID=89674 RepID=UPI001F5E07C8|nr:WW domain-binding protein 11-like [Lolium rigidum]